MNYELPNLLVLKPKISLEWLSFITGIVAKNVMVDKSGNVCYETVIISQKKKQMYKQASRQCIH